MSTVVTSTIDTTKVQNRRRLRFNDLDEMMADVEQLAQGRMRALGNWSPGQVFMHLAIVMNKSIDGFEHGPPWIIRVLAPLLFKRSILKNGMSAGFVHKGKSAEEMVPPATTTFEEGLDALRRAVIRQKSANYRVPSPFLGKLTYDEWIQLHCRHAELHLSFLVPEA